MNYDRLNLVQVWNIFSKQSKFCLGDIFILTFHIILETTYFLLKFDC